MRKNTNKSIHGTWHIAFCLMVLFLGMPKLIFAEKTSLCVLTINVWSGLDYKGTFRMGEYEDPDRRETRYQSLLTQVKELDPDIIFVQEANPVAKFTARIADALGFDSIHQVCLAGIKFGHVGIPSNFKEGMSILARPSLELEKQDAWKLSGSFGIYGDAITIHFDESIFSVVGRIIIRKTPVFLVNVHLASLPPKDPQLVKQFEGLIEEGKLSKQIFQKALEKWEARLERQSEEMQKLIKRLSKLPPGTPVIVAGDFNAVPDSSTIQQFESAGYFDVFPLGQSSSQFTWDASRNRNIAFSTRPESVNGIALEDYDLLNSLGASVSRRIDYIFLSRHFPAACVEKSQVVLDSSTDIQASDHFGMISELDLQDVITTAPKEYKTVTPLQRGKLEFLPILMYDTNVGFGYGGKLFYLNPFKKNESFDLVVFNSTKGVRWYRFQFSIPDFERRQGKIYPFSLDLLLDFDKWIDRPFFGLGQDSRFESREIYTREPFEARLTLSRGFSPYFVAQIGASAKTIMNKNFQENSRLQFLEPELNQGRVNVGSLFLNLRYDTRNSFINPSRGVVLQGEAEFAPKLSFTEVSFTRLTVWLQNYYELFYPRTVLAMRFGFQSLIDGELPVQVLLPVGGGSTLRGYPQDRFLGEAAVLFNAELRFPIFGHLGGVAGFDAGRVWDSLKDFEFGFRNWATDLNVGLRFYFETFVVRMDIGFSKESTGFCFNFGHVF